MDMRKTSLLLPSAYRGRQLRSALDTAYSSTSRPLEICVSIVADDNDSRNAVRDLPVVLDVRTPAEYELGAVYAWNKLLKLATGDFIALWADDLMPQQDWLGHAIREMNHLGNHGLIGLNDLSSDGEVYAAHWLADRAFIENELGGVMYPPMYKSWWADREVTDRARAMGVYRWARRALVEHLNYTFGKSSNDRTYQHAAANYETDRVIYETRKAAGFPLDWLVTVKEAEKKIDEDIAILPVEPEPAAPVATVRRKYSKGSMGRSDRSLADSER